jgi:hypothetical protein
VAYRPKGPKLSKRDVTYYQKIVVALAETISLMKETDKGNMKPGDCPGGCGSRRRCEDAKQKAEDNSKSVILDLCCEVLGIF